MGRGSSTTCRLWWPTGVAAAIVLAAGGASPARATDQPACGPREGDASTGGPARSSRLLARMLHLPVCFPQNLTPDEMESAIVRWGLRPPGAGGAVWPPAIIVDRFDLDTTTWTGDGQQGPGGQARAARLTISFPADGTIWGLSELGDTGPNVLGQSLTNTFGADNLDLGREFIRQAFGTWRRYSGLTYQEVADNGIPMDQVTARRAGVGDIRIGGLAFGTGTFLAYNAFPSAAVAGVGGGDMVINTSFFLPTNLNDASNAYRYLRNVIAHEHGHGLGFIHQIPCLGTRLMEPLVNTGFDGLSVDERRGAGRSFGDRFAGNHLSAANARELGDLTGPVVRSAIERDLSLNGVAGPQGTGADWFTFQLTSAQPVTLSATPTGGVYTTGQQVSGCSGVSASVNAQAAGDLRLDLFDSASAGVPLASAASTSAGQAEELVLPSLGPGRYWVRVSDVGPNPPERQIVQTYDLAVRVAGAPAPPYANAGINKLVRAGRRCFFIGDINSASNEPGGRISVYEWDLDGDDVFETAGPRPSRVYDAPGVVPVTLRVTDSNGLRAIDRITVTVVSAPPPITLSGVSPSTVQQGAAVPITINGTGFTGLGPGSLISFLGDGLAVEGSFVVSADGTRLTGLTARAASAAALGPRTLSIFTGQDRIELPNAVTITGLPLGACCDFPTCFISLASNCGLVPGQRFAGVGTTCTPPTVVSGACCPADVNGDGVQSPQDIFTFLQLYFAGDFRADLTGEFELSPADIFEFLQRYFRRCTGL